MNVRDLIEALSAYPEWMDTGIEEVRQCDVMEIELDGCKRPPETMPGHASCPECDHEFEVCREVQYEPRPPAPVLTREQEAQAKLAMQQIGSAMNQAQEAARRLQAMQSKLAKAWGLIQYGEPHTWER